VKGARAWQLFTSRELEILDLLGRGKTSKEIAVLLKLRVTTIASHRKSICRKLGVHSTAELIRYAVEMIAASSLPGGVRLISSPLFLNAEQDDGPHE
jgi:DNA-binding CsgD family transcriptional regulator